MAYEQQKDELSAGIATSLLSLAVQREYPLHPSVGLWGFTQGIQNSGVDVGFDNKSKKATFHFHLDVDGIKYYVPVESEYSHLIAGAGSVPGSPQAYLDSLGDLFFASHLSLYDSYGVDLTGDQVKKLTLHFSMQKDKFEKAMHNVWADFFDKYHENCLVSVEGSIPQLTSSTLLPVVLDDENVFNYVEFCRENIKGGRENDEFQSFVNDVFLAELATSKGYPIQARDPRKIEYGPFDTLVPGHLVTWRNLEKLVV